MCLTGQGQGRRRLVAAAVATAAAARVAIVAAARAATERRQTTRETRQAIGRSVTCSSLCWCEKRLTELCRSNADLLSVVYVHKQK